MKPSIVAKSKIDGTFIHQSKCYRSLKLVGIVTKKFSTIHFNSIEKRGSNAAQNFFSLILFRKNILIYLITEHLEHMDWPLVH